MLATTEIMLESNSNADNSQTESTENKNIKHRQSNENYDNIDNNINAVNNNNHQPQLSQTVPSLPLQSVGYPFSPMIPADWLAHTHGYYLPSQLNQTGMMDPNQWNSYRNAHFQNYPTNPSPLANYPYYINDPMRHQQQPPNNPIPAPSPSAPRAENENAGDRRKSRKSRKQATNEAANGEESSESEEESSSDEDEEEQQNSHQQQKESANNNNNNDKNTHNNNNVNDSQSNQTDPASLIQPMRQLMIPAHTAGQWVYQPAYPPHYPYHWQPTYYQQQMIANNSNTMTAMNNSNQQTTQNPSDTIKNDENSHSLNNSDQFNEEETKQQSFNSSPHNHALFDGEHVYIIPPGMKHLYQHPYFQPTTANNTTTATIQKSSSNNQQTTTKTFNSSLTTNTQYNNNNNNHNYHHTSDSQMNTLLSPSSDASLAYIPSPSSVASNSPPLPAQSVSPHCDNYSPDQPASGNNEREVARSVDDFNVALHSHGHYIQTNNHNINNNNANNNNSNNEINNNYSLTTPYHHYNPHIRTASDDITMLQYNQQHQHQKPAYHHHINNLNNNAATMTHHKKERGKEIMHIATAKRVFQVTEFTESYDESHASQSTRQKSKHFQLNEPINNKYQQQGIIPNIQNNKQQEIHNPHHSPLLHPHHPHQLPHPPPHPHHHYQQNPLHHQIAHPNNNNPAIISSSKKSKRAKSNFDHIAFSDLKFHELIGEGSFGQVYRGTLYGQEVAIKRIRLSERLNFLKDFKKEVKIMKALRHPNIVEFLGACMESPHLCLVTEYLSHGSLEKMLSTIDNDPVTTNNNKNNNNNENDETTIITGPTHKWSLKRIISLAKDIARGLNWLHHKGIIHRDLKSANILLDNTGKGKICDFGLSHVKQRVNTSGAYGACGSLGYMAPEVLKRQSYGVAADIFSFGVCLCELLLGKYPYEGEPQATRDFEGALMSGLKPIIPAYCPSSMKEMIENCLSEDPNKRPSMEDIFNVLVQAEQQLSANESHSMFDDCPPQILEVIRAQRHDLNVLEASSKNNSQQLLNAQQKIIELENELIKEKLLREKAENALAQTLLTTTMNVNTGIPPLPLYSATTMTIPVLMRGNSSSPTPTTATITNDGNIPMNGNIPLTTQSRRTSLAGVAIVNNNSSIINFGSPRQSKQTPVIASRRSSINSNSSNNSNNNKSPLSAGELNNSSTQIPTASPLLSSISAPITNNNNQRLISGHHTPTSASPLCLSPTSSPPIISAFH